MTARVQNSFTIDVEDWFHARALEPWIPRSDWDRQTLRVERNIDRLLVLLDEAGTSATFFVLGWLAERVPAMVKRIAAAGHEIACHSYDHRQVYDMFRGEFREQLHRSLEILRQLTGDDVVGHRAPNFSLPRYEPQWAYEILALEGVLYDSSVFPIHRSNYGNPDAPWAPFDVETDAGSVRQFPLPVISLLGVAFPFGGGGYFRVYPYRVTECMMKSVNGEGRSITFYIHPWELDPDQPRLPVNLKTRFRHYRNLETVEERIRTLLQMFDFVPCRERLNRVEFTA